MMQTGKRSIWVIAILLAFAAAAGAQTVNGAIIGVVKDSSGGVVPDTALTLRNVTTDQTVGTTVSGADGAYAFRNLSPAKYEVQAIKPGFQLVTSRRTSRSRSARRSARGHLAARCGGAGAEDRGHRRLVGARHDGRRRSTASRPRRSTSCRCS